MICEEEKFTIEELFEILQRISNGEYNMNLEGS